MTRKEKNRQAGNHHDKVNKKNEEGPGKTKSRVWGTKKKQKKRETQAGESTPTEGTTRRGVERSIRRARTPMSQKKNTYGRGRGCGGTLIISRREGNRLNSMLIVWSLNGGQKNTRWGFHCTSGPRGKGREEVERGGKIPFPYIQFICPIGEYSSKEVGVPGKTASR